MADATSDKSNTLTAKQSLGRGPLCPPLCPSRDYSSSSSQLFSDTVSGRAPLSERGEPRSFPVLTPPSETPLEAARTLLEGPHGEPFGFGAAGRGGALFAPDMTPPARSALFGAGDPPGTVASDGTEAMFTPSLDTPRTVGAPAGGAPAGKAAVSGKAPAAHARSLSGLLRACVVDTFGLGGGLSVSILPQQQRLAMNMASATA